MATRRDVPMVNLRIETSHYVDFTFAYVGKTWKYVAMTYDMGIFGTSLPTRMSLNAAQPDAGPCCYSTSFYCGRSLVFVCGLVSTESIGMFQRLHLRLVQNTSKCVEITLPIRSTRGNYVWYGYVWNIPKMHPCMNVLHAFLAWACIPQGLSGWSHTNTPAKPAEASVSGRNSSMWKLNAYNQPNRHGCLLWPAQ